MTTLTNEAPVIRLRPFKKHPKALAFIKSKAKRKVARCGRRGAKTTSASRLALECFLAGQRVLYAVPTSDQLETFWYEITRALASPTERGVLTKNKTRHSIEEPGTRHRIRAKTAWNADTLRGDYADLLILDEFQLMDETAWTEVGQPMLLDNDGDGCLIYTPPSLVSRSSSRAKDKRFAAKLFKQAQEDDSGRWEAFHWSSHDNPYISQAALSEITYDMTAQAVRQEIEALDMEDVPGALWTQALLDSTRVATAPTDLVVVAVGVDPPGGATECGIVVAALGGNGHYYITGDYSCLASPDKWGGTAVDAYLKHQADTVLGEVNYGGDMVEAVVRSAAEKRKVRVNYQHVRATRGKAVRAQPVVAAFEQGRAHIVGELPLLEEELCEWVPGTPGPSPNRLDAMVWAATPFSIYAEPEGVYVEDTPVEISRF